MRAADISISVDIEVDIVKESADIILLEKSLMVLEEGVLEGRKVFSNILKYIRMGASSNFSNMFSVLGARTFLPMLQIQILTNDLLYDFSVEHAALNFAIIMGVSILLPHSGLSSSLGFVKLPTLYWSILLLTLLCYFFLTQSIKTILLRRKWI